MSASSPRSLARRVFALLRHRPHPRVSVEPIGEAYAGDRLLLRLHVDAPVDVTVRDARVRLRRALTIYGFSGENFGLGPRFERKIIASETFSQIGHLAAGSRHEEISRLPITDRLPSVWARRIHVVYRVKVRVRFQGARTRRCSVPVRVASSRSHNSSHEKRVIVSGDRAQYFLHLEMPLHARPGERLAGTARVSPPGEGVPGPVVVELRRREEASRAYRNDRAFAREWTVHRAVLADGVPGPDTASLPFEITIPPGACTVHADHTAVRWLLYLLLPGMGAGDVYAAWEINVHTGNNDR
jgi:hypothetical protein